MNQSFSSIIPTKNRPKDLVCAINSILKQNFLPNELIIVDQSDSKESFNLITSIVKNSNKKLNLVYVYEPTIPGLVAAKQKGVEVAQSDLISFLEDDIILQPNYFKNMLRVFDAKPNLMGCCGVETNKHNGYLYNFFFKLFHLGLFCDPRVNAGEKNDFSDNCVLTRSKFLSGGISFYRKSVFDEIEFDIQNDFHMLEDIDFSTRAVDYYGEDNFFIVSNICVIHNMSPINRQKLKERWHKKMSEYLMFYKKNSFKPGSFINLIWLLVGLFFESIISSIIKGSIGPLQGTITGIYSGIKIKPILNNFKSTV